MDSERSGTQQDANALSILGQSHVARFVAAAIAGSRIGAPIRAAARAGAAGDAFVSRVVRDRLPRFDKWLTRESPPIRVTDLTPILQGSRLCRQSAAILEWLQRADESSRLRSLTRTMSDNPESTIAIGGWVVAIAMATHILLLGAEPYAFPSRAALVLPLSVLVAAVAAIWFRHALAAGWTHRK